MTLRLEPDLPVEFPLGSAVLIFPNVAGVVLGLVDQKREVRDESGVVHLVSVRALQERHDV